MITAIPLLDGAVSSHFTKADALLLLDASGNEIARHANPARQANCAGKQSLLTLLQQQGVTRVIVRNIGEQMLGKLLSRQMAVFQSRCGRLQPQELACAQEENLIALTQASQGRQSLNHAAHGEHGCHKKHQDQAHHGCCQGKQEHHGKGACCQG